MAHLYADRVKETATGVGTGNLLLGGAVAGYQGFDGVLGLSDTTDVCIEDETTGDWEVTRASVLSGVLVRGTLLASSTGSRIAFAAGTKKVFIVLPAAEVMRRTDILSAISMAVAAKVSPPPADGKVYGFQDGEWVELVAPYDLAFDFGPGMPTAGDDGAQSILVARDCILPDDFGDFSALVDVHPTATATFTIKRKPPAGSETTIGTVSVETDGSVIGSFSTPGDLELLAGSRLRAVPPDPQDATLAGFAMTFPTLRS